MPVHLEDSRGAARGLGLSHAPVCVHSSLRSFGHVQGGARTVIDGLRAENSTVLAPTFSWEVSLPNLARAVLTPACTIRGRIAAPGMSGDCLQTRRLVGALLRA
jgi:hypothetical protein